MANQLYYFRRNHLQQERLTEPLVTKFYISIMILPLEKLQITKQGANGILKARQLMVKWKASRCHEYHLMRDFGSAGQHSTLKQNYTQTSGFHSKFFASIESSLQRI